MTRIPARVIPEPKDFLPNAKTSPIILLLQWWLKTIPYGKLVLQLADPKVIPTGSIVKMCDSVVRTILHYSKYINLCTLLFSQ